MEKIVKYSLFYNYHNLGDVLLLTNNVGAKCAHVEKKGDVVALYDNDNILYGFNIFNLNNYIKIYEKGLLPYPFDYIVDIVNIILENHGYGKIPYYNFSGVRVGKIKNILSNKYIIDFVDDEITCIGNYNGLHIDDIILYGYPNVLLPSLRRINNSHGEILKENDLFLEGKNEYIFIHDTNLIGQDFYKGKLENGN